MPELERLAQLLVQSGDVWNPDPETIRSIVARVRRLAVVGISRDPMKDARRVPSYLAAKGLEVLPVNPAARWLLGRPVVPTLEALREPVDLVLVFRPSKEAGPLVAQAAQRPEKPVIWLQEGIRADAEASKARSSGRVVVQDLCLHKVHRALDENLPRILISR
jgi:uncharacterized protein